MLSGKTNLQIIFINQSLGKIIAYHHLWLCSKGVYVVGSTDTSKVIVVAVYSVFVYMYK